MVTLLLCYSLENLWKLSGKNIFYNKDEAYQYFPFQKKDYYCVCSNCLTPTAFFMDSVMECQVE